MEEACRQLLNQVIQRHTTAGAPGPMHGGEHNIASVIASPKMHNLNLNQTTRKPRPAGLLQNNWPGVFQNVQNERQEKAQETL